MKTLYAACLARLGLSQTEAAALHDVRLDTVKSWAVGRNAPPPAVYDELRAIEAHIVDASEAFREIWPAGTPIEIDDSEAGHLPLMAAADFVLNCDAPVETGRSRATLMARQARRPN